MSTLLKVAQSLVGKLHSVPAVHEGPGVVVLPAPVTSGGMPLLDAVSRRRSQRDFQPEALPLPLLSNLLWCGFGINREQSGGRTVPSAMNMQEIDIYVAMSSGLYRYEPRGHQLLRQVDKDVRPLTGYQDFVDKAPLDLIYVADTGMAAYAPVVVGAIAQNIYLYCASAGLATVLRAWIDRDALARAMGLASPKQVLMSQTIGLPAGEDDAPPRQPLLMAP